MYIYYIENKICATAEACAMKLRSLPAEIIALSYAYANFVKYMYEKNSLFVLLCRFEEEREE